MTSSAVLSHVGLVRSNQEDLARADDFHRCYVLADGMGGHDNGEVAARVGVAAALSFAISHPELPLAQAARGAVVAAHRAVLDAQWDAASPARRAVFESRRDEMGGMGATLVVLLVGEGRAAVAHVGDSRCYQMKAGSNSLVQLTEDHSAGRHTITRALGHTAGDNPDVREVSVSADDLFLLCSDGLCGFVPDRDTERVVASRRGLARDAQALIDLALRAGGHDNVTVALVAVGASPAP